jgi:hypothetical protein
VKRQQLKVWTTADVVGVNRHLSLVCFAPIIAAISAISASSLRIPIHQNSER